MPTRTARHLSPRGDADTTTSAASDGEQRQRLRRPVHQRRPRERDSEPGGGCPGDGTGSAGTYYVNNGYPNLVWSGNIPERPDHNRVLPGLHNNGTNPDNSQHPYWRSEMMQKVMNLTTVRTHQYAVWITIGFFEVKRQGDLRMRSRTRGRRCYLAFDILGPEIGAVERPDDAVPGLLPGRPDQALRLRRYDPRQLHPGRRLSPDDRIMTLIVVSSSTVSGRHRDTNRLMSCTYEEFARQGA